LRGRFSVRMSSHAARTSACATVTVLIAVGLAAGVAVGADAEREKDVYDIFSLMLNDPHTGHWADNSARYLISETTGRGMPRDPCVTPPKERGAEYREVLTDFERRKDEPRKLERKLELPKPYLLLSADDVKKFRGLRLTVRLNEPPEVDERFRGVVDLFTLTDVYFNPKGTLALTAIESWCGGLCALWQWKVFEKSESGEWHELQWQVCTVVSENRVWHTDQHADELDSSLRARRLRPRGPIAGSD
jgi:hypothetical protein